jgi:hypothetical protein
LNSSFEDIAANIQATQNYNMWGEQSSAIADSTEDTAKYTDKLVGINTDMLDALTNLTSAISSASGIITSSGASASVNTNSLGISSSLTDALGLGFIDDIFNSIPVIGDLFSAISGFFGGSSSITDTGVKILGDTIGNLIDDTMVLAYQNVSYKTWRWGSTKNKQAFVDAGDSVSNQFSLVFSSLADSVYEAGTALGFSSSYLTNAINNFVVDTATISLKDLSTEEQTAAIQAYFSDIFSDLATSVVPWLTSLQQTGEELGTTMTRVASEVQVLNYAVDNLGVMLSNTSVKSVAYAADAISSLLGGVDNFAQYTSSFISSFATDSQQLEIYGNALSDALSAVGLSVPATTEEFYNLMDSINASTTAGQEQVATLLAITDTASEYYSLLEDSTSAASALASSFRDAAESLYDVSYASEMVSLDAALAAAKMGDLDLANSLDLTNLVPSTDDYSNSVDYAIAVADTAAKLQDLASYTDGTSSVADRQLTVLEEIRDSLATSGTISTSDSFASLKEQIVELYGEMKNLSRTVQYSTLTVRVTS